MEQICIYCGQFVDNFVCEVCNEYDGVMSIEDAAAYLPDELGYLVEEL